MRKYLGAGLVWLALMAVVGQADTVSVGSVKATNVSEYAVALEYQGKSLGTFSKDGLSDLMKGIRSANGLIKRPNQKAIMDMLKADSSIRARIEKLQAGK